MATALTATLEQRLTRALEAVCGAVGIDPGRAELIKFTVNAVYKIDEYVVRLAQGSLAQDRAARVVAVARAFAACDAPTVTLADDITNQPVAAGDWVATVWRRVPAPGGTPSAHHLAGPLRALHSLDAPPVDLPAWSPIDKTRDRLALAISLPADDAAYTHSWAHTQLGYALDDLLARLYHVCDRLDEQLSQLQWHLPTGVVHGDAHTGNLLLPATGRPVLCDLDSVAIGPCEWDLVPTAHGPARFGRSPACQRPSVSPHWRPAEFPTGGHRFSPLAATKSPQGSGWLG